ncbi:MAG: hypothetical protein BWY89_00935 [Bacteroidetes bacterium ADurb.BinA012]|nr:MAG: hypothetical protein BWY89_00935 [Bacteroidetes bacterium ADurb.BinA012]
MRRVVDYSWFNPGIGNNFTGVKFSHPHSDGEEIHQRPVNLCFGKYSQSNSFQGIGLVNAAAIGVNTCLYSQRCRHYMVFSIIMPSDHIINRAAVAGYITVQAIGFPRDGINKVFACRDRYSVYSAVGCHY